MEPKVDNCLNDPIATVVEEIYVSVIPLAIVYVASKLKLSNNSIFDVRISEVVESGQLDSCLKTRLGGSTS